MTIVYVSDMPASVRYYEGLGFTVDTRSRGNGWTELRAGEGAVLALHIAGGGAEPGRAELSMVSEQPLEGLRERSPLTRDISDEAFGRSIVLRDPDGLAIQVNEHDRELYTT